MYLKTPRRYQGRRRRSPFSLRWLWLWILTPLVVYFGKQLYDNRAQYTPQVEEFVYSVAEDAQNRLATVVAPTALPTQDPTTIIARANDNWSQGRVETATQDYAEATRSAPNDVGVHYRAALGLLMEGRTPEGLAMAERAITANPFSADAWAIRTLALVWDNRPAEAVASGLYAVELDPQSPRALAFLAEAYKDIGREQLAKETAERAVKADPNTYEGYRIRAWVEWDIPNYYDLEAARADFETAHSLAPNLPQTTLDLSLIITTDDYQTPIGLLSDVIELNPNNPRVLYWLGNYYYRGLGDFSQGAEYLGRCVDANPDSVACQGLLGRAQMSLENYNKAVEALAKAIELGSTDARHYLWLGRSHIALGDCPAAVPVMQAGYTLANATGDSEALTALAENLAQCQSPVVEAAPAAESTAEAIAAEATAPPEGGS